MYLLHLYRVDGSQDAEIVDHQEPVHGLEVAVSLREAAGDQVVAVHVEVGEGAAVGVQGVADAEGITK